MASLADYSASKYLDVGDHLVKVMSYKEVEAKTHTRGIEFTLNDAHGGKAKETCWITEDAMWRLKLFAVACGLSDEEMRAYDPFVFASHQVLVNHKLHIRVVKGEKYHEVDECWSTKQDAPDFKPAPSPEPAPVQQGPKDSDIPF